MKNLTFLTAILIASLSFAQVPTYVPTNGLVGWWPFNGNANDESGNGNNGTVNGATLTSDRFNSLSAAYHLDGNGDNIYVANNFFDNGSVGWSLSVWYNLDQLPNPNNGNSSHILFNTSPHNGMALDINWGGSSKYSFFLGNGTPATSWNTSIYNVQSNQNITQNSWKHVVLVKSGNTYSLFIDGVFDINWISNTTISSYFYQMYFGSCDPGVSNEVIIGDIDDIGIWNRALTDCEIKDLYNSQLGSNNTSSSQTQTALDTYTWPVNNQTYTQSGTYSDTLVNAAGCDSIVTLNLTLSYTGINELSTSTIAISPNPTNGDFTLTGLELFNTISSMTIKDVNGKTIKELDPKTAKFSLGTVKAGVYFLTITAGNKQEVVKLIKE